MNLRTSFIIKFSPKIRHNSWSCPDISSVWTSSFAMLFNYFLSQIQFVTTATKYLRLIFFFYISDHHAFCVRCCTGTRDEYGQVYVGQLQELRTLAWRVVPLISTSHLIISSFPADKKLRRRQRISPANSLGAASCLRGPFLINFIAGVCVIFYNSFRRLFHDYSSFFRWTVFTLHSWCSFVTLLRYFHSCRWALL
jgi:hypothetical protein